MRRQLAVVVFALLFAAPAFALDMPIRKAGLWELKMDFESRNLPAQVIKQCTDASTDKLMTSNFGGPAQEKCSKRDVNNSGGIKALGGAKMKLVLYDTGDSAEKAKNAAQRLVAQEPDVVGGIGCWLSTFTLAVTEVTERAHLPVLTLSYSDLITGRGFKYIFQTSATAGAQAERALAAGGAPRLEVENAFGGVSVRAGAPGAVLNAVNDALAPFGARVTSQPITPEVVLKALGGL